MRVLATVGIAVLIPLALASPSAAKPDEVDESTLVPALSGSFVPWACHLTSSGPVCKGERHLHGDWTLDDEPGCDVPVYNRRTEDRYQTRYYGLDNLEYHRRFRTNDVDEYSTSSTGPGGVSIRTNVRWTEEFTVPGDDSTLSYVADGVHWKIQGATGAPVYMVVGRMVTPYGGDTTFTGHVTQDGVTTRYVDAAFDDFFDEDWFFSTICELAIAEG
ncbi:hypothetical protein [Demequina iriomotensis]|uniref:hypothetical protein n=1 Tax=Demequina iriomotensis TaxID=1536641 RepID=UPI0007825533|nr:hypothetical protein [Demequina iriomotensis]